MDRKSATEFHKEGLNMKPEQNEDWTGSIIVKGLLDIVKVTIEKTPIPYEDVGTFMKGVSDQLAASIKVMDEALLEALARRGEAPATERKAPSIAPAASAPTAAAEEPAPAASSAAPAAAAPSAPAASEAKKGKGVKQSSAKASGASRKTAAAEAAQETAVAEAVAEAPAERAAAKPKEQGYKFAHISRVPVVPVDQSVQDDHIVCLIDGEKRSMLHRHIRSRYGMSEKDYKAHFGLPDDYPLTAPGYAKEKRIFAIQQGLGTPKLYENAKSRQEQPTPAKVSKRKREKADTSASA